MGGGAADAAVAATKVGGARDPAATKVGGARRRAGARFFCSEAGRNAMEMAGTLAFSVAAAAVDAEAAAVVVTA